MLSTQSMDTVLSYWEYVEMNKKDMSYLWELIGIYYLYNTIYNTMKYVLVEAFMKFSGNGED